MDDAKMLGYQKAKTVIDTGTLAGVVTLKSCETLSTVNYSFLGQNVETKLYTGNSTLAFPSGAQEVTALMVGPGADGGYACSYGCYGMGVDNRYCSSSATGGGNAAPFKIVNLEKPTSGDVVSIYFNAGSKNYIQYKGATIEVLAGVGQQAGGSTYTQGAWSPDGDAGQAKSKSLPAQCGYTTLGRFGINSSADYPTPTATLYGFGHGGMGWYECNTNAQPGNVIYPDPGVVAFEYKVNKWMRPDGTTYIPSN